MFNSTSATFIDAGGGRWVKSQKGTALNNRFRYVNDDEQSERTDDDDPK